MQTTMEKEIYFMYPFALTYGCLLVFARAYSFSQVFTDFCYGPIGSTGCETGDLLIGGAERT